MLITCIYEYLSEWCINPVFQRDMLLLTRHFGVHQHRAVGHQDLPAASAGQQRGEGPDEGDDSYL